MSARSGLRIWRFTDSGHNWVWQCVHRHWDCNVHSGSMCTGIQLCSWAVCWYCGRCSCSVRWVWHDNTAVCTYRARGPDTTAHCVWRLCLGTHAVEHTSCGALSDAWCLSFHASEWAVCVQLWWKRGQHACPGCGPHMACQWLQARLCSLWWQHK